MVETLLVLVGCPLRQQALLHSGNIVPVQDHRGVWVICLHVRHVISEIPAAKVRFRLEQLHVIPEFVEAAFAIVLLELALLLGDDVARAVGRREDAPPSPSIQLLRSAMKLSHLA